MSERFAPKEIRQDPDVQIVGGFGGLSSASYQSTGEVVYADKLVNAIVTSRNEIQKRKGSRVTFWLANTPTNEAEVISTHTFTFDNINYMAVKIGRSFWLAVFDKDWQYLAAQTKSSTFLETSRTEEATITTVIEGDICYVLAATRSTPLLVFPIIKRTVDVATVPSVVQLTANMSRYPAANNITQNNLFVFTLDDSFLRLSSATQSAFTLSLTTSTNHGLTVGNTLRAHFWYSTAGTSCNYYPGSYVYNASVRRNTVPLDVNVAVPATIYSNPIINESQIQDLSSTLNTTEVWKDQVNQVYTRGTAGSPSLATVWDYSDGNYLYGGSTDTKTTRSPFFISFGALTAGGAAEAIYFYRLRELLVCPNTNVNVSDLNIYFDKTLANVRYFKQDGTTTATNEVYYWTANNTQRPALSAVVEIVYVFNRTPTVVDLSPNQTTITIGDGFIFPIYGYSSFADIRTNSYPNQVITVGNRVVMSGFDNKVVFSHADWFYRGISWNNFQVSDIDFNANSAYIVSIGQRSSKVVGLASVNGVIIAGTDTGVYRISGTNVTTPPNATTANTSRLSNEIVTNGKCLLVYESRVFFVSSRGLYQLQYSQDTDEINLTPISTQVSDIFSDIPVCLSYSEVHRAFIVYFRNTREILVYTFESETFSTFKLTFAPVTFAYSQSFDGFCCAFADSGGNNAVYWLFWDKVSETDISNALGTISIYSASNAIRTQTTINPATVSVGSTPTDVSALTPPADFLTLFANNLQLAYGSNHVVSSTPPTVVSYPTTGGRRTYPIEAYFVSKAFSSDKLMRSHRIRAVNLLLTGAGSAITGLVLPNRTPVFETTVINDQGTLTESLNEVSRVVSGDLVNIRLRLLGVGEYWSIACVLTGTIKLLGYQVDTSTKKKGKL